jgi:2-polyprenyl-3-methyl-5-hydroxy-6-metoxy-1,4-benzoquinol methylase
MHESLLEFIKANYPAPATALDLGAGQGIDVGNLEKIGWRVKGVDLPQVDLNNVYEDGEKYDLVYSNAVLQFINEKDNFVKTCLLNLKDGGRIFIQTFAKGDKILRNKTFTEHELETLFKDIFKDVTVKQTKLKDYDFLMGDHEHEVLILTARK